MSAEPLPILTPEDYLELERRAVVKSEFINGQIVGMAGATREHNLITLNVASGLLNRLRGKPCETYTNDMRVRVDETGLYTYLDVVVACGEPQFEDTHLDTLLNPTVIIEVLSPSTEAYDRGEKFAHYRKLPSLQSYLLIAQDRPSVELFTREGGRWVLSEANDLSGEIVIPSLDCSLPLTEIYSRITFPEAGTTMPEAK